MAEKNSRRKFLIILAAFAVVAGGGLVYFLFFDTYHFAVVQPNVLYRDGFQGMRRLRNAYRQRPFKTIINLQSEKDVGIQYKDDVATEKAFCAERGMKWFHIPMNQKKMPTDEEVQKFVELVKNPDNQPVLAHDSQGVIREGMMVAAWQRYGMNLTYEQCKAEVRLFGHPEPKVLMAFIDRIYGKGDLTKDATGTKDENDE